MSDLSTSAIIVAAGSGSRMQSDIPKQFLMLGERPVLYHTISKFLASRWVAEILVVVSQDFLKSQYLTSSLPKNPAKPIRVVVGGKTRQDSVEQGFKATDSQNKFVLTHDGVRPLIATKTIDKAIEACENHDGVIVGTSAVDTLTEVEDQKILRYIDREVVWQLQTPQIFPREVLEYSFKIAKMGELQYTDESSMVKPMFDDVCVFPGEKTNIKITVKEDVALAKAIMEIYEN